MIPTISELLENSMKPSTQKKVFHVVQGEVVSDSMLDIPPFNRRFKVEHVGAKEVVVRLTGVRGAIYDLIEWNKNYLVAINGKDTGEFTTPFDTVFFGRENLTNEGGFLTVTPKNFGNELGRIGHSIMEIEDSLYIKVPRIGQTSKFVSFEIRD